MLIASCLLYNRSTNICFVLIQTGPCPVNETACNQHQTTL